MTVEGFKLIKNLNMPLNIYLKRSSRDWFFLNLFFQQGFVISEFQVKIFLGVSQYENKQKWRTTKMPARGHRQMGCWCGARPPVASPAIPQNPTRWQRLPGNVTATVGQGPTSSLSCPLSQQNKENTELNECFKLSSSISKKIEISISIFFTKWLQRTFISTENQDCRQMNNYLILWYSFY